MGVLIRTVSARKVPICLIVAVFLSGVCLADENAIRSVAVTGVTGAQLTRAQRVIHARAGDPYSEKTLQDDLIALLDLSFVQNARAKKNMAPEGVDVIYELTAKGAVSGVHFVGNRKFKSKKLLREGNLEDLKFYDQARLAQAAQLIVDKYKKSGYPFAKVDFTTRPDGSVLFKIVEGRRLKVARVTIIGNAAFDDAVLKKAAVKTKTRKYLILPYRLDENVAEEDRLRLQDYYRDNGYLDAKVGISLYLTKNGRGIVVDYLVTEGPLYTVRSVAITGNTKISTGDLLAAMKMNPGKPFSSAHLAGDVGAVKAAYGHIGCIDCGVVPSTLFVADVPEVEVAYVVTEGEPIDVGEVEIIGNDKTRDNVVRRDLEFFPGQRFDTDKMDSSKKNLQRLSYFSSVDISPDEAQPGASPRGVTVKVEEMPTGRFMIGAGISSNQGVIGQIAFEQRNFDYSRPARSFRDVIDGTAWAGGGQTFQLEAAPGSELSQTHMLYRDPRVNDSDYSFGLDLHLWKRMWETYDESRTGGGVTVGRSFTKNAFWETGFTADIVKISNIDTGAPPDVHAVDGTHQVNTLEFTLGHDTRDNFLMPTMGHRVTATVGGSLRTIGSDYDFARLRLDGNFYRAVKRDKLDRPYVLSSRATLGLLFPETGEDAPIFERFFAGGGYDVRGFEYRGLGPRQKNEPLGGKFLALGGVQYEVPLVGEYFRGAIFYDAGTLLDKPGDFTLKDIRHSVGFGIRVVIPPPLNMPVTIDFGFPLRKNSTDRTQVFSFSIGRVM